LEFVLYKEAADQQDVVGKLSFEIKSGKGGRFNFAGVKDKRGRTSQKATVVWLTAKELLKATEKARFRGGSVAVGNFRYVDQGLSLGDNRGNRFELVLRNVEVDDHHLEQAFAALANKGFYNYFGLQRFGTSSVRTSDVGLALVKRDWKAAIELILAPREGDFPRFHDARCEWWQYRQPGKALKCLSKRENQSIEGRLLNGLKVSGGFEANPSGALDFVPRGMRSMYLHAYQSYVFNHVLSARVEKHGRAVLVGDLYFPDDVAAAATEDLPSAEDEAETAASEDTNVIEEKKGPTQKKERPTPLRVTEENIASVDIYQVALPLVAEGVMYPENDVGEIFNVVLARDGLARNSFGNMHKSYLLTGGYRLMLAKAKDVQWRTVRYDKPRAALTLSDNDRIKGVKEVEGIAENGHYKACVAEFTLAPSTYATMAVRELTKRSTEKAVLTELSNAHDEEAQKREEAAADGEPPAKVAKTEEDGAGGDAGQS